MDANNAKQIAGFLSRKGAFHKGNIMPLYRAPHGRNSEPTGNAPAIPPCLQGHRNMERKQRWLFFRDQL